MTMKKIYKSLVSCVLAVVVLSACESTDLDITQDPNALVTSQARTSLLINSIQEDFGELIGSLEVEASETVRIVNMDGFLYEEAFEEARFDNEWSESYQQILQDIRLMTPLANAANEPYHRGIAQVLESYIMLTLVDLFGEVPYSEANLGAANLNPKVDAGAIVYAAVLDTLSAAIENFGATNVISLPTDFFYGGKWSNWIKAANTLKMKAYLATRLVDSGNGSLVSWNSKTEFNKIVEGGDFIGDTKDDFEFSWGISNNNPESRHPQYRDDYTGSGAGSYQSVWFMNYMFANKSFPDPRMKYYFYRQTAVVSTDANQINCIAEARPDHYDASDPFCIVAGSRFNGYWGRNHGDEDGIGPDTQARTAYGVYPAGGRFDDDSFKPIASIDLGAAGAGITPIMLASWVDFMRAEFALAGGDATAAGKFVAAGAVKSLAKVRAFGSRDGRADLNKAPAAILDTDYVDELNTQWDGAENELKRWDILGQEYFVALFGNGIDGFNFYRRARVPTTLQPNESSNVDKFFRTFLYPPRFYTRNSSVDQKSGVTAMKVFWDTGDTPPAN